MKMAGAFIEHTRLSSYEAIFMHGGEPKDHEVSALRKDDAYVLYIQRNRSDELASSFCLSWAAKRLLMLGMTGGVVGMIMHVPKAPWSAVAATTAFRLRSAAQSIEQESRRFPHSQGREHKKAVAAASALQTAARISMDSRLRGNDGTVAAGMTRLSITNSLT